MTKTQNRLCSVPLKYLCQKWCCIILTILQSAATDTDIHCRKQNCGRAQDIMRNLCLSQSICLLAPQIQWTGTRETCRSGCCGRSICTSCPQWARPSCRWTAKTCVPWAQRTSANSVPSTVTHSTPTWTFGSQVAHSTVEGWLSRQKGASVSFSENNGLCKIRCWHQFCKLQLPTLYWYPPDTDLC